MTDEVDQNPHRNQNILRAELVDQCWLAEMAAGQLHAALLIPHPSPDPALPRDRMVRMTDREAQEYISWKLVRWLPVQTILESAAFASSLLCLSDDDNTPKANSALEKQRLHRLTLAKLLVGDLSVPPLLEIKERTVRNQLIHTGEKVTRWANIRETPPGFVGLGSWAWGKGPRDGNFYRWLDEETWDITVNEHTCSLRRMVDELSSLAMAVPVKVAVMVPRPGSG